MESFQNTDIVIRTIRNSDISEELDSKIRAALVTAFPHNADHFGKSRVWFSVAEWNIIAMTPDQEIAGNIAVIERIIMTGEGSLPVRIFGPQNVMVLPKWRKTGLLKKMMDAAVLEAGKRDIEAGFLFCRRPLADKVYTPLGWKEVNEIVYVNRKPDEKEPRPSHDLAMMYPLTVSEFPRGSIDLKGPDW